MADAAIAPVSNNGFRQFEFYAFTIVAFAAKSFLLIRLPYRPWYENTHLYELALRIALLFFQVQAGDGVPAFRHLLPCDGDRR